MDVTPTKVICGSIVKRLSNTLVIQIPVNRSLVDSSLMSIDNLLQLLIALHSVDSVLSYVAICLERQQPFLPVVRLNTRVSSQSYNHSSLLLDHRMNPYPLIHRTNDSDDSHSQMPNDYFSHSHSNNKQKINDSSNVNVMARFHLMNMSGTSNSSSPVYQIDLSSSEHSDNNFSYVPSVTETMVLTISHDVIMVCHNLHWTYSIHLFHSHVENHTLNRSPNRKLPYIPHDSLPLRHKSKSEINSQYYNLPFLHWTTGRL